MEIDIREVPEGDRLTKVLDAIRDLSTEEVLTVTCAEHPGALRDSVASVLGESVDQQTLRWVKGKEDPIWLLHVKRSLRPSAYRPEED